MIKFIEGVIINSQNSKKLADFYIKTLGLKLVGEREGEDGSQGFELKAESGVSLYINEHSDVKVKNNSPQRAFVNFEVDDFEKEFKKLKKAKVKTVGQVPYHLPDYGFIATFEDPDGNYFQIVKTRS